MSRQIAELKDSRDRGVQVSLTEDGVLVISGADGAIALKRGGASNLRDALGDISEDELAAETPPEVKKDKRSE